MSTNEQAGKFAMLKPFAGGVAVGAIALLAVGFGSGWLVTASTMESRIYDARVELITASCAAQGERTWLARNESLDGLQGWDNREAREEFVGTVLTQMSVPEELTTDVGNDCEDALS